MPLAPGQIVNARYRIIRLLGQGGFGAVYHAWDINLDRPCALKENLETAEKTRRQFEREARILANLSHPHLPRVTDHFLVPNQGQYLVMDFVDGEDLEQRLMRRDRPLEEAEALDWIGQVCVALRYLHHHDPPIIHRDIKPANIRITPEGKAMLVDFGIAKMMNPNARTTIGARAVTPGYSPPEQYGQGTTDERSDIFALGATLYTLLSGAVPPDSVDVMAGNQPPAEPVEKLNPKISPVTSQAVKKAMSLTRSERFQSANDFCRALKVDQSALADPIVFSPVAVLAASNAESASSIPLENSAAQVFPGTVKVPQGPSVLVPLQKTSPRSRPSRKSPIAALALMGLGGFGLALLGGVAVIWIVLQLLQPSLVGMDISTSPAAGLVLAATATPVISTSTPDLIPTVSEEPTDIPQLQPKAGAILAALPPARIAFVSDHGGDGKDLIYVTELAGGQYWFSREETDEMFVLDPANSSSPFSDLLTVPGGDDHDIAWWPDWCDNNSVLVFEAQDTRDRNFQTIYQVPFSGGGAGIPEEITWEESSKIGVPRCAHTSRRAIASGLDPESDGIWRLYSFDLDQPDEPARIGDDGFPFSGFVSWSSNDRTIAFMHSENGMPFDLYAMEWDRPGEFSIIPAPEGILITRFPAISPLDGRLAYACSEKDAWALCLQDISQNSFSFLLKDLGPITAPARGVKPASSGITPSWSPDGQWLAYAANKDGDWDVYLINPVLQVHLNITENLGGDQFHPVWSKP